MNYTPLTKASLSKAIEQGLASLNSLNYHPERSYERDERGKMSEARPCSGGLIISARS